MKTVHVSLEVTGMNISVNTRYPLTKPRRSEAWNRCWKNGQIVFTAIVCSGLDAFQFLYHCHVSVLFVEVKQGINSQILMCQLRQAMRASVGQLPNTSYENDRCADWVNQYPSPHIPNVIILCANLKYKCTFMFSELCTQLCNDKNETACLWFDWNLPWGSIPIYWP